MTSFTYGLEIELADVDRQKALPSGCSWNALECDIVNSDGRAIDPSGVLHSIGGDVNTPVTTTREAQAAISLLKRIDVSRPHNSLLQSFSFPVPHSLLRGGT